MRLGRSSRAALVALPLAAFACATEPNFTYYDDTATDSSMTGREAGAYAEASTMDSTTGDDGELAMMDDASDAGSADDDVGTGDASDGAVADAALDAPAEAGCGSLLQVTNCGACGVMCDTTNSMGRACSPTADAAACTYSSCDMGFADCDPSGFNANGCETPITTPTNCGGCGVACDAVRSNDAGCNSTGGGPSTCTYSSCATGYADCDAAPPNANGCETAITTTANCGACGVTCNTANALDAGCGPSGCTYECVPGWSNCNTTSAQANGGGCECNTPVCCQATGATPSAGGPGYGCATTHSTGVAGGTYTNCQPLATYTEGEAMAACTAYAQTQGMPASDCLTNPGCKYGATTYGYSGVYYLESNEGYVWIYSATNYGGYNYTVAGNVYPVANFCVGEAVQRTVYTTWN
jgi:hypothetical protein